MMARVLPKLMVVRFQLSIEVSSHVQASPEGGGWENGSVGNVLATQARGLVFKCLGLM